MKKNILYKLSLISIFMSTFSCNDNKPVFDAFSDGFLDYYSLKIYADGSFVLHVPFTDGEGQSRISGDTIFLNYKEGTDITKVPEAYLINREHNTIDEISYIWAFYQKAKVNRWMQIRENNFK